MVLFYFVFVMLRRPALSTLFPYTTLFRSLMNNLAWLCARCGEKIDEAVKLSQSAIEMEPDNAADRKSTRLNSSHANISYAVFCLKKKKKEKRRLPLLHLMADSYEATCGRS